MSKRARNLSRAIKSAQDELEEAGLALGPSAVVVLNLLPEVWRRCASGGRTPSESAGG